jgi:hypothetical protein
MAKKKRHCTLSIEDKPFVFSSVFLKHIYIGEKCMYSMWGREQEIEEKLFDSNSVIFVLTCFELIDLHLLLMRLDSKYKVKWRRKKNWSKKIFSKLSKILTFILHLSVIHIYTYWYYLSSRCMYVCILSCIYKMNINSFYLNRISKHDIQ